MPIAQIDSTVIDNQTRLNYNYDKRLTVGWRRRVTRRAYTAAAFSADSSVAQLRYIFS